MRCELTTEQIARYREQGFLSVPGLLTPAEVVELRAAVLEAIATMGRRKVAGRGADLQEGDSYYDKVFTQRLNLWKISPTVKRYMLSPDLGRMLCQLEDVPAMRVWHDQALIKEPFANPTAWHLDNPYWSFYSPHAISIWIALADATPHNGCMYYLPGSHKMVAYDNVGIGENLTDLFKVYPRLAELDSVAAPMQAGDCGFHNGLTAHGAGANMTRTRRIAMTCAYMPDGSVFNGQQNILPDTYCQTLRPGEVLCNEEHNPIVGRRV